METGDAYSDDLIQDYLSGTLSADDADRFYRLLKESPEFFERASKHRKADFILRLLAKIKNESLSRDIGVESNSAERVSKKVMPSLWTVYGPLVEEKEGRSPTKKHMPTLESVDWATLEKLAAAPKAILHEVIKEPLKQAKTSLPISYKKSSSRNTFGAAFCIVTLLMMIAIPAIYYEFRSKPDAQTAHQNERSVIAQVSRVSDPIFSGKHPTFKKGQTLDREDIHLDGGLIELEFKNGVRIVLEGPNRFKIHSMMETFCERGRVSVEVPGEAVGFEVRTPFMTVRDLGTEFMVEVDEEKSAVHVINGKVEFDKLVGNWFAIKEGYGRVVRQDKTEKQITADQKTYVDQARMIEASNRYEKKCQRRWTDYRSTVVDDPDLLIYMHCMNDRDRNNEAETSLPKERGIERINGTREAEGRWSGKRAFAFSRSSDRIHLTAPKRRQSFTLIASVCPERLVHAGNTIFSIGDVERGSLHWQINFHGELQLLLGMNDTGGLADFCSPPIISRQQWGTWFLLATVLDAEAGTIVHYIDGKEIARFPWKKREDEKTPEFDFSRATLGNREQRNRTPVPQFFNGRIDEFVLLGRVAAPEELQP